MSGRPDRLERCPKGMRFGPCGGVTEAGGCEVPGLSCPFAEEPTPVLWPTDAVAHPTPVEVPRVVIDFRPDPLMRFEVDEAAEILSASGAAVLIGDHLDDPTPHRPCEVAEVVVAAGLRPIVTVTCRCRSVEELDSELERLGTIDIVAVHCVTGDHPAARLGLSTPADFALDGFELANRATRAGLAVSVAESPSAPPTRWRAVRLASKAAAGAGLAVLNHAGGVGPLIRFADEVTSIGAELPLVAPVPVVTDRRSAAALSRFPGLRLPPDLAPTILAAADPVATGIELAVDMGRELLDSGRFAGINLSGSAAAADIVTRTEVMARVCEGVLS